MSIDPCRSRGRRQDAAAGYRQAGVATPRAPSAAVGDIDRSGRQSQVSQPDSTSRRRSSASTRRNVRSGLRAFHPSRLRLARRSRERGVRECRLTAPRTGRETYVVGSGTVRLMEPPPSDSELVARSLEESTAFEPIFDRHFSAVHVYLHRRAGRDLADELAAETFALAFSQRASFRGSGAPCPGSTGSQPTCSAANAGRSAVDCVHIATAESIGRFPSRTRRLHAPSARCSTLAWPALSQRCGRASEMHYSSTRLPTSATRRSPLRSPFPSERSARGYTGPVRPLDASSHPLR